MRSLSETAYASDNHEGPILVPGNTYTWHWSNPTATFNGYYNYDGSSHCLFNFNNVCLCDDNGNVYDIDTEPNFQRASTDDIVFCLSLDNEHWSTFYHCKSNYHMAHSIDLATHPYLKDFFNDTPGGSNTLYFKIINNPGINLKLVDGGGYINVYRYYKTKPCCPTITSSAVGGGTISPSGGPFTIPEQGKTFDMSANSGYQLSNVAVDGTSKGTSDPYTVQMGDLNMSLGMEGHEIEATFTSTRTLTISSYGTSHGYTSPPYGQYYVPYGYQVTICAYPDAGWKVYGWFINGQGQPQTDCVTFTMTENTTVQVLWVQT